MYTPIDTCSLRCTCTHADCLNSQPPVHIFPPLQPSLHFAIGGRGIHVFDCAPTNKVREPPTLIRYNARYNSFVVAMGTSIIEFSGEDGREVADRFTVMFTVWIMLMCCTLWAGSACFVAGTAT